MFAFDLTSNSLSLVHSFGFAPDGSHPPGGLLLVDGKLYGTATSDIDHYGGGIIFSVAVPEPASLTILSWVIVPLLARCKPHRSKKGVKHISDSSRGRFVEVEVEIVWKFVDMTFDRPINLG